jgi:hypothetical protein
MKSNLETKPRERGVVVETLVEGRAFRSSLMNALPDKVVNQFLTAFSKDNHHGAS